MDGYYCPNRREFRAIMGFRTERANWLTTERVRRIVDRERQHWPGGVLPTSMFRDLMQQCGIVGPSERGAA